ncbi:rhomboid family intramembrane serine protease [uncultured Desulfovibrio sp.]|uniref:rhomboid family intramembrane serine protease n=2 Tax=uncultured Desulfovibrio sp. TaxID=167968 RepID=UPI0025D046C2|nr:rhomboid family intramembrane serine protease [uncultured Desulfovibrio sp.]
MPQPLPHAPAINVHARLRWRVRPASVPAFWRNISGASGFVSYRQRRDWRLVLSACDIPHRLSQFNSRECLYVPPLLERVALRELTAFDEERHRPAPPPPVIHAHWKLAGCFLLPLLVWHGMRMGWWPVPDWLPAPRLWLPAGALDTLQVRLHGQWYRVITALTLHADAAHLFGNLAFGALFLALLARSAGIGRALWLTLAGGILGNCLAVALRRQPVESIGFSTALFACIGALSGLMALRHAGRREMLLPVAAGAALLAMLGTEGERTDYLAHVAGLCCGLTLGMAEGLRLRHRWRALPQWGAAALAMLVPVLAWWRAFARL